jgi:hypothetical protein
MIAFLERSLYYQAYKFDSILLPSDRIIDISVDGVLTKASNSALAISFVDQFDDILPNFEEPHELVIMELNRDLINIGNRIEIPFSAFLRMIPLTAKARQLLEGRVGNEILLTEPFFENIIEKVRFRRYIALREKAVESLFAIFGIRESVDFNFKNKVNNAFASLFHNGPHCNYEFINNLVCYDKTPSFLPQGNAEFLSKVGLVAMITKGENENKLQNGAFLEWCLNNQNVINKMTLSDALDEYLRFVDGVADVESRLARSFKGICESIGGDEPVDSFKIAYYYIALKSLLQKSEFDLSVFESEIKSEIERDGFISKHVLYLIGYTYSFEILYAGIHKMRKKPSRQLDISVFQRQERPSETPQQVLSIDDKGELCDEGEKLNATLGVLDSESGSTAVLNEPVAPFEIQEGHDEKVLSEEDSVRVSLKTTASRSNKKSKKASKVEKSRLLEIFKDDIDFNMQQIIDEVRDDKSKSLVQLVEYILETAENIGLTINDKLDKELNNLLENN